MDNRKIITNFYWLFLVLFLVGSLTVYGQEPTAESQYLSTVVLCKNIAEKEPVWKTTSFFPWDEKVVCWVSFNYYALEPFAITWKWEDPMGNIYRVYQIELEPGIYQNYRTWYWIAIRDSNAKNLPGNWKVSVYRNDALLGVKEFTLN